MLARASLLVAVVVVLSSCSRDLTVPPPPPLGSVIGALGLADGGVLSGLDVVLEPSDGEPLTVASGADGGFSFFELTPGQYVLRVSPVEYLEVLRPVNVVAGTQRNLGTLILRSLNLPSDDDGRIDGTVRVERDADPTGAEVTFTNKTTGQLVARISVGAAGRFSQAIPTGTWQLQASHPFYVSSPLREVEVAPREQVDLTARNEDLTMAINPATLEGRVLREVDLSNTPLPAAGASVSVGGSVAITDMDGRFRITGLAGGNEEVALSLAGFHDGASSRPVRLVPMQTTTLPDITLLLDRGDLTGEVEMADNAPLRDVTASLDVVLMMGADAGTTVNPYSAAVAPSATAPSRGAYLIKNVPAANYAVKVSRENYITATSGSVLVEAGRTRDVGLLRLVRVQGDFAIDDGDTTNTPGFTRTTNVTLRLTGALSAIAYRLAEDDPLLSGASFVNFGPQPDGGVATPSAIPFSLSSGDGSKTLSLQYRDAMNNVSAILNATVVLDTQAPDPGTLELEEGRSFTRSNLSLLASVSSIDPRAMSVDAVSGVAYVRLSGVNITDGGVSLPVGRQAYQPTLTFTRGTTGDGPQAVYAQFIDNAGNESVPVPDSIVIDTLPPTGSMTISDGTRATSAGFTHTPLVDLNFTSAVEPNGGYVQVRIVNENAADLPNATLLAFRTRVAWFLDPIDGLRTVRTMLVDAAGNSVTLPERSLTLDTTPPTASASLVTAALSNQNLVTMQLAVTDGNPLSPTQALTLSEDPTFPAAGSTTPAVFPSNSRADFTLPVGDGQRRVYARLRDAAGNDATASVLMTLDQAVPTGTLSVTGALADGTPSSLITATTSVTVRINQSGASLMLLGNETLASCPASAASYVAVNDVINGHLLTGSASPRQVRVCLRDGAGNLLGPLSSTITLDSSTPSGCTLAVNGLRVDRTPAAAGTSALRDITATVSGCSETPTEIFLTDGALTCAATTALNWDPYQPVMPLLLTGSDGSRTVRGCVRDAAGNTGTTGTAPVTLDTTPPTIAPTVLIDNGAAYVNEDQVIARLGTRATVAGNAAGATEWALSETSPPTNFVPITASTNFTFGDAGVRTVYALFRDDVGNTTATVVQDSIEFDVTDPTGPGGTGLPSLSLTGASAAGTPSQTLTATTAVDVDLRVSGAAEYVLGNETMVTCPSSGWVSLTTPTLVGQTLTGSASPRVMRVCYRDAALNTVGPFADTISLDSVAPTGCTLTIRGFKKDATAAPANRTALQDTTIDVLGCSETPTEIYLTESTPTCVANASLEWTTFGSPAPFFFTLPHQGTHTVRGCVRDAAGNVSTVIADDIVLDTIAPATPSMAINGGASWVNASQVSAGNTTLSVTGSATTAFDWGISTSTPTAFSAIATQPLTLAVSATPQDTRRVFAVFRDDLQNASEAIFSTITIDTDAPDVSAMTLDILSTGAAGYGNSEIVTLAISGSNDAAEARLAEHAGSGSCVTGDFVASSPQPMLSSYTFALTPAEGPKRVCVRYRDAAGNVSATLEDTLVLDKTPPTAPQIVTADQYARLPHAAIFSVDVASASTDVNFARYERLGGLGVDGGTLLVWSQVSPSGLRFDFRVQNDGGETGVRNEFRLRALDLANNASGESVVFVTADTNPPDPVTWKPEWIDNGNARATAFWIEPAVSPDIAGYRLFYGATPTFADSEAASFAAEGLSPVIIPRLVQAGDAGNASATLSSLPNGVPTYARLRPFDLAGNVGLWLPDAGTSPWRMQPGEVSINELSLVSVPADYVQRTARAGNVLYAVTANFGCNLFELHTYDMHELASPIQNGKVQLTLNSPELVNTLSFPDVMNCSSGQNGDLVVDGTFLYAMSSVRLHVLSLLNPLAPVEIASIDLTAINPGANFQAQSFHLMGDRAVISGKGGSVTYFTSVISLAALYDNAAGTDPTTAGAFTLLGGGVGPMASAVVRDRLVVFPFGNFSGTGAVVNLAPAFAASPTNPVQQNTQILPTLGTRPPASGNLIYTAGARNGLQTFDTTLPSDGGTAISTALSSAYVGAGQFEVLGHQVMMPDDTEAVLRVLDLEDPLFPRNVGRVLGGATPSHVLAFGNNAVVAGQGPSPKLWFYELATPRALRSIDARPAAGWHPTVVGSFLHTGAGISYDLQSPGLQPAVPAQPRGCSMASVARENVEVTTRIDGFTVRRLDPATDRVSTTNTFTTYDVFPLAGSPRITDAELWGNRLLLASIRPTGVFIEVCDARKLFNRSTVNMTAADCATSIQVVALTPNNNLTAELAVSAGRVAVGLDPTNIGSNSVASVANNLYFIDLSGLFDDDSATVVGAVHNAVATPQVREIKLQGNYAYVATASGLWVVDITEVMDSTASMLPASPTIRQVLVGNSLDGVGLSGSLALTTPSNGNTSAFTPGVYAVDVSTPLNPEVVGLFPRAPDILVSGCQPPGDPLPRHMRARVVVAGTRAYLAIGGTLQVLELE